MSEFGQLVQNFEQEEPITADDLMPFGVQIVSINDLRLELERQSGVEAGIQFMDLVVMEKPPRDPDTLESFLKNRTDYISVGTYKRLKELLNGK